MEAGQEDAFFDAERGRGRGGRGRGRRGRGGFRGGRGGRDPRDGEEEYSDTRRSWRAKQVNSLDTDGGQLHSQQRQFGQFQRPYKPRYSNPQNPQNQHQFDDNEEIAQSPRGGRGRARNTPRGRRVSSSDPSGASETRPATSQRRKKQPQQLEGESNANDGSFKRHTPKKNKPLKQAQQPGTPKASPNPRKPFQSPPRTPNKKIRVRKPVFEEYWDEYRVKAGLVDGTLKQGSLRVNPFNRMEAYCTVEGMAVDILVEGRNQNRAFNGDTVVVQIFPEDKWTYLKGIVAVEEDEDLDASGEAEEYEREEDEEILEEILALEEEETRERKEENITEAEIDKALYREERKRESDYDEETSEEVCEEEEEEDEENHEHEEEETASEANAQISEKVGMEVKEEKVEKEQIAEKIVVEVKEEVAITVEKVVKVVAKAQSPIKSFATSKMPATPLKGDGTKTPSVMSPISKAKPKDRPTGKIIYILEAAHKTQNFVGFLKPIEEKKQQQKAPEKTQQKAPEKTQQQNAPVEPKSPTKAPPTSVYFVPADRKAPKFLIRAAQCPSDFYLNPEKHANTFYVATFNSWPANSIMPRANLVKALGTAGEILSETEAILQSHSVDTSDFHPRIIAGIADKFILTDEELAVRKDFRQTRIFTIDPPTARDLDDALHVTALPNGNFEVGVHIADVSYYIQPGSELDTVACSRATSVYLVHRVIPMLPRLLCENLCSLNPGVDRLAFSVVWELTPDGTIIKQWFGRSVICSAGKLAYDHAQKVIEDFEEGVKAITPIASEGHDSREIAKDILNLHSIAAKMRQRRYDNGALSLGKQKLYFEIDENYNPTGFRIYVQKESNFLIEEFMLLANMSVGKFIYEHFPENSLLRNHPCPNDRKLAEFTRFCEAIGIDMDITSSGSFHDSLQQIPEKYPQLQGIKQIVEDLATRPMQMALYFCTGDIPEDQFHHYALNVPFYTHFTSPIRRYADVCVHRLLQAALTAQGQGLWSKSAISKISANCNTRKTNARKAQQDGDKLYLAVYLKDNPLTDDACIVSELGRNFLICYSPLLGLCVRVFLDGYTVDYDQKEYKSVVTKKIVRDLPSKPVGSEKKQRNRKREKEESRRDTEEKKEEAAEADKVEAEEAKTPFSIVLRPLSTIKVHFTMSAHRPVDIKGFLIPEVPTKNTYNVTL